LLILFIHLFTSLTFILNFFTFVLIRIFSILYGWIQHNWHSFIGHSQLRSPRVYFLSIFCCISYFWELWWAISGRSLMIALMFLWFSSQIGSHPSQAFIQAFSGALLSIRPALKLLWFQFFVWSFIFVLFAVCSHHNIFAHGRSNLCPKNDKI